VYERTAPKDVCKRAEGAEVVFTNKVVLDEAVLEKLPSLKYIGVLATGYNVVDVAAAARKGIVVTNIPAYSTSSVAQMAFAHILNIVQRVGYYAQEVSNGKWSRQADFSFWDAPLHELDGKKIGIIGFGNTGRATARIAVGFGLDVYAYTSKSAMELPADVHKCPSMDELFRKCDIVIFHTVKAHGRNLPFAESRNLCRAKSRTRIGGKKPGEAAHRKGNPIQSRN
jgi:glycerate dehydrogenase